MVSSDIVLRDLSLDGDDLYWLEGRPAEGGRGVIVRRTPDGETNDVTPPGFNVRTRVHEYGGGAYLVDGGTVYFSNFKDQRLYRQDHGSEPRPITPETEARLRYADCVADRKRGRLICVREDHTVEGREPVNTLAAVSLEGDGVGGHVLVEGNDFYSSPRISPDGSRMAWLTWHHPNMPWDGTELWVGEFAADGAMQKTRKVAGGPEESVFQPEWSPDGTLYFVSERTGWWNIYRLRAGQAEPLFTMEAEFGVPQWAFRQSTYAFESAARIVCMYNQGGNSRLATINTSTGQLQPIANTFTSISSVKAAPGYAYYIGASYTSAPMIIRQHLETGAIDEIKMSSEAQIDPGYVSMARANEFPTEGGLTAHAFFYKPKNCDYRAPEGEKPPLLVKSHGGPTDFAEARFDLETQYWTSRGIAVLDVNYGGSTGYGREYRQRLNGQWGVVDVDDCVNGARYLVEQGLVDGDRLIIRGGSAGGYTTLNALTFRDTFKVGASYYGVGDLEALATDTHKFESRYLDSMVGPYPDRKDLYYERSAINFTDRLSCPIIFFQGLEDKVVLPNQTEMMVDALRKKGLPVAYLPFEGEGHGFRKAENIKRSLDAEFYFYARIFGYEPADDIEPVEIENL
jgi:dipeptidyl aminopeptidase/acylaminoacyl peptidase